jgi:hypothetical protein
MKYIITESKLEESILYYINELFDVNNINSTHPLEYDEETGEEPLGDNDEYSDEESSFDAETTDGSASSFDAENYDSLDGDIKKSKKEISKREKIAKHIRDKDYRQDAPDEGDDEYAYAPFKLYKPDYQVDSVNESKKDTNEDLGVWFGTKKKPKGSKQPKGPWVNICSKKDGKHPPCGRPEGDTKGYPKCRAVGVAAKMTDSQKQSACQQKRKAEKKDTQTGKGQKPVMTSYKPKKKKTNESVLISLIRKSLS